jgi:hypothetical protein
MKRFMGDSSTMLYNAFRKIYSSLVEITLVIAGNVDLIALDFSSFLRHHS